MLCSIAVVNFVMMLGLLRPQKCGTAFFRFRREVVFDRLRLPHQPTIPKWNTIFSACTRETRLCVLAFQCLSVRLLPTSEPPFDSFGL